MPKAQFFRWQLLSPSARNRNRRRCGRTNNAKRANAHFDPAGVHVGIHTVRLARDDLTLADHDGLHADRGGNRPRVSLTPVRPERELHEAGSVAQIEKDQLAKVSAAMHPATELHATPHVAGAECSAGVTAHGCREHILGERRFGHVQNPWYGSENGRWYGTNIRTRGAR